MVETLEMTRVPCGWKALLQSFKGSPNYYSGEINSALDAAMGECRSILSRKVIRRRETMTTIAIKDCWRVHWCIVPITCVKGLIAWIWLRGFILG
jgi:hypothetical protein